jgi:hypothetical protein
MLRLLSFFLLMALLSSAQAQEQPVEKVQLRYLQGKWLSQDSVQARIDFVQEGEELHILPRTYVHPYTFRIEKDSVSLKGLAMNWPPYYCRIKPIDEQTILIEYLSYISEELCGIIYERE